MLRVSVPTVRLEGFEGPMLLALCTRPSKYTKGGGGGVGGGGGGKKRNEKGK